MAEPDKPQTTMT